jgi:hypothetical protein
MMTIIIIIIIIISYDTVVTTGPLYSKGSGSVPSSTLCLPALHDTNSLLCSLFCMRNSTADFSLMRPLPSVELKLSFMYLSLNAVGAHKTLVRD